MAAFSLSDTRWMKLAIDLGKSGIGFTEPNPFVGAAVVKNDRLVSAGFHRSFGAEHAEVMALNRVSEINTTLYVPLEPCCHFGKTPPCTDLIISKKVRRVVIAISDPNPLVNGQGIRRLKKNRIRVDPGCLSDLYGHLNRHYLKFMTQKRPFVTLKAGVSLDGKLTDKNRKSRWVTDPQLRRLAHSLRGEFSAILVGYQTVREDDPLLTLRDREWKNKKLVRVVLDSENRLEAKQSVFQNQRNFPLFIFSSDRAKDRSQKVEHHYFVPADGDELDLNQVVHILFQNNIASVLVEGGGRMIDSFVRARLADEMILFTAHKLIGGAGAVELFRSGASCARPIVLRDLEIWEFSSGHIVRGRIHWG